MVRCGVEDERTSSSSVCLVVIIDGGCSGGAMLFVGFWLMGVEQSSSIVFSVGICNEIWEGGRKAFCISALVIVIYPSILIMTSVSVMKEMRMLGSSSTGRASTERNSPDRRPVLCISSQSFKVPWNTTCFGLSILSRPRLTWKQLVSANHKRQVKRAS